jgi:UDP-N-acetylmuramate: L-alanyl-gamma-D-glutamyl-meso-diaminopimelate ligase
MERKEVNSIHFVGICGTAMAAVAALCRELGCTVSGSDQDAYPPMSVFLESRGIPIISGFHERNLDHRPDLIVIGNAMKRGTPEVERALDERLRFCSLPELVRELLLAGNHSIVVAGTHGKTTTASLLAWTLETAGRSPGFLIGGIPNNFGCGARLARGGLFVIEGDEYDTAFFDKRSKFVHYRPDTVILNNIEFDHADIFADIEAVRRAFRQLLAIVPRRGLIVANRDDDNVRAILADAPCRVLWFGGELPAGMEFALPGRHNLRNAVAAATCAAALGVGEADIRRAFASFQGVKRRMEVRGEPGGVTVLDDFAHHPTAIAETIRAIREKYPRRRLWALFEPRSNSTRRNVFERDLTEALALADGVFIARVDRLHELPEHQRLNPERIVETLRRRGRHAEFAPSTDALLAGLVPRLRPRDVIAVFSNGRFDAVHDRLLAALAPHETAAA